MIGQKFWTTGISIKPVGNDYFSVSLDFDDDGHAQAGSTCGSVRYKYYCYAPELFFAVTTLKADAEKLGILFTNVNRPPSLYVGWEGEQLPANIQEICQPIADSIHFRLVINQ